MRRDAGRTRKHLHTVTHRLGVQLLKPIGDETAALNHEMTLLMTSHDRGDCRTFVAVLFEDTVLQSNGCRGDDPDSRGRGRVKVVPERAVTAENRVRNDNGRLAVDGDSASRVNRVAVLEPAAVDDVRIGLCRAADRQGPEIARETATLEQNLSRNAHRPVFAVRTVLAASDEAAVLEARRARRLELNSLLLEADELDARKEHVSHRNVRVRIREANRCRR